MAWLASAAPAAADRLHDIRAAGVLRAAVYADDPPFCTGAPGGRDMRGYDVDIARAIAAGIGVRLQMVPTDAPGRLRLLRTGAVDVIVADMTITPARAQSADFSVPYFRTGQQLLVRAHGAARPEDYADSRIGLLGGTSEETYLAGDFPAARLSLYPDVAAAVLALRADRIDAIVLEQATIASVLADAADRAAFQGLPDLLTQELIGATMPRHEPALLDAVNVVLLGLERNGEAARIYHRWFDPLGPPFAERGFTIEVPCEAMSGWSSGDCPAEGLPK